MMPPSDGNEQYFARFKHELQRRSLSEERISIVIRSFAIHLAVNPKMVVDEVGLKRRDQSYLFAAQYLCQQNVHRVVMERRYCSRVATPKNNPGPPILGV